MRKKPELYYVYTVDVEVNDEEKILRRCKSNKVTKAKEVIYAPEQSGTIPFKHRPVVIGMGPAGLSVHFLLQEPVLHRFF